MGLERSGRGGLRCVLRHQGASVRGDNNPDVNQMARLSAGSCGAYRANLPPSQPASAPGLRHRGRYLRRDPGGGVRGAGR